jgi:hypothetical protein
MMDWISIKDRLPAKDTEVLVYYFDKYMDVMEYWYDNDEGKPQFYAPPSPPTDKVTHWMPLPDKPKMNNENNERNKKTIE